MGWTDYYCPFTKEKCKGETCAMFDSEDSEGCVIFHTLQDTADLLGSIAADITDIRNYVRDN